MPNRLRAVNLVDFTGGLNLRPDTVQLLENEVPEILNMDVEGRGGLRSRRGWEKWNFDPITSDAWDPRSAYLHLNSDGTSCVLMANNSKLYCGDNRAFHQLTGTYDAVPHLADYVSWGNSIRIATGWEHSGINVNGITEAITVLTPSGGANWQNDYSAPGTGTNQPQAEMIAQHAGYLFVARTKEAGTHFPNRVRWSHPNNPNAWASNDFIDISEGGAQITALLPFLDRLLIFKPDSVWALYGYNAETWEMTNVSRSIGCVHNQAVCRSETVCWFLSWPQGVFALTDRSMTEASVNIRRIFLLNQITRSAVDNIWLGWVNRRLWVSIPVLADGDADDVTAAFVLDTEVGQGAWTKYRGADLRAPGPYLERPITDMDVPLLAFSRTTPYAIVLDARVEPSDELDGTGPEPFTTAVRTRWIDAGAPTHRKSWRRPDFLVWGNQVETEIAVSVFHDYNHVNPARRYNVLWTPLAASAVWNRFDWNDGTVYGSGTPAVSIERGSTMGRTGVIQVRAEGALTKTAESGQVTTLPPRPWGFQGVIFKFIPRRFR